MGMVYAAVVHSRYFSDDNAARRLQAMQAVAEGKPIYVFVEKGCELPSYLADKARMVIEYSREEPKMLRLNMLRQLRDVQKLRDEGVIDGD